MSIESIYIASAALALGDNHASEPSLDGAMWLAQAETMAVPHETAMNELEKVERSRLAASCARVLPSLNNPDDRAVVEQLYKEAIGGVL